VDFNVLFGTAAIVTAIGIIVGGIIATYRLARKIGDAIGVNKEGKTLSERMDRVEHQVWPNGGSSLADQIKATSDVATETAVEVRFIKQMLLSSNPTYVHVDVDPQTDGLDAVILKPKRTRKKVA
jgi:hypothetical protein